jgi:hypothetical protein
MRASEQARQWFGRPRVVLVCGSGEFVGSIEDTHLKLVHAQTAEAIHGALQAGAIDAAVIEEDPIPGVDASTVARELRIIGIGTVLARRARYTAEQSLRERLTVCVSSPHFRRHLVDAIWIACLETELVRNVLTDLFHAGITPPATPRIRYTQSDGQLAPSESTMAFVFGDLCLSSIQETPDVESSGLIAPSVPVVRDQRSVDDSRTVSFSPSDALLRSLREKSLAQSRTVSFQPSDELIQATKVGTKATRGDGGRMRFILLCCGAVAIATVVAGIWFIS